METSRQIKLGRQIQKDLSEILNQKIPDYFPNQMLTVTTVRVSNDLGLAKAYISVFPSEKNQNTVNELNLMVKILRNDLGQRIRHQVKKIPELNFYVDDSLDYIENIEKLLKK